MAISFADSNPGSIRGPMLSWLMPAGEYESLAYGEVAGNKRVCIGAFLRASHAILPLPLVSASTKGALHSILRQTMPNLLDLAESGKAGAELGELVLVIRFTSRHSR